jgi:hypothetical protein
MKAYETSATVEDQGQVRVTGVPFAPGTPVDVAISPKGNGAHTPAASIPDRVVRLFAALDKGRNLKPIGRLKRDELYDRNLLH